MTVRDRSVGPPSVAGQARQHWAAALHHALVARATELASTVTMDAVERALHDALAAATAAGRWADVAALARELDARGRARGKTLDLAAEREKRRG